MVPKVCAALIVATLIACLFVAVRIELMSLRARVARLEGK